VKNSANPTELTQWAETLMQSRQTILPKRLIAPGPDASQLQLLLSAAASAPDHGQLLPWRFIIVPQLARARLGAAFAASLRLRDPKASPEQLAQADEKAHRAPTLILLVVDDACGDLTIALQERILSAGCATQNILLMATAMGFGSALTSGKALSAAPLRGLFKLRPSETALCFISVGTVAARKPGRTRPLTTDYVSELDPD
jgi:nitroreductase